MYFDDQVLAILAAPETYREIGAQFGISSSAVWKIKQRRCYSDIGLDTLIPDRESRADRMRGESNPAAKLTETDVRDIRNSALSSEKIATDYGVCAATVRHIRNRRIWRHV